MRATDRVAATERLLPAAKVGEGEKEVEVKLTNLLNANPPPIDAERVKQIRQAIENGTYSIEPAKIADAMIVSCRYLEEISVNNRNEIKDALRQMFAVMEQERQALAALDIDAITGARRSKTALCDLLSHASNDNLDEECLSLIEAAKRLNEVNRQIRNLIAANVASRLDALTGAPALYKLAECPRRIRPSPLPAASDRQTGTPFA